MATFVLVHGGGHGGWCWRKVVPLLVQAGHTVYTPTLTGMGERLHLLDHTVNLEVHVEDLAAVLRYEDLSDVILVGHSYGGIVIAGAADRALDRVAQLVFLDAIIPEDGDSVVDIRPDLTSTLRAKSLHVNGVEVIGQHDDTSSICGVSDAEDLAWMRPRVSFTPWDCIEQPLHLLNPDGFAKLPRSNINTTERLSKLNPKQQERAVRADRIWEIDTGHDVMITEPIRLAEMLLEVAGPSGGNAS